MAIRVIQNIPAMTAARNLNRINETLGRNIEQLSTGYRINHARDDAAGLEISEQMRAQVRGLTQAERNIQDGISLIHTAEAGLIEMTDMLQRMRELAVQSANAIYTSHDRFKIQLEIDNLAGEISRLASSVEFNKNKILSGQSFTFMVGANYSNTIGIRIHTISAQALGVWDTGILGYGLHDTAIFGNPTGRTIMGYGGGVVSAPIWSVGSEWAEGDTTRSDSRAYAQRNVIHINSKDMYYEMGPDISSHRCAAESAIVQIDSAISFIVMRRAELGAMENRLEHTLNAVGVAKESIAAAESRIRDLDIAEKVQDLTREQILMQTSAAMLAQANTIPSIALSLI